jgi:hypothetical protein
LRHRPTLRPRTTRAAPGPPPWTSIARYEFFDEEPDAVGRSEWLPGDENWRRILPWAAKRREPLARTYYAKIHDERGALVTFLVDWVLVQEFLANQGYRHGFLAARPLPQDPTAFPAHLTALLDQQTILAGLDDVNGRSMSVVTGDRHPFGPQRHPLSAAHASYVSDTLLPWSERLVGARPR